ncbi:MAG: LysR family transcriptional regulator [Rhizobacter sp.]|nr:LysR family transcriptional regulator [Bacteriovorax sp.]
MDLLRLKYFLVLNQTEHLRKASEILGITPPALSKAIKLLELEIGEQLVTSEGRGLKITDKGREVAKLVTPSVEHLLTINDQLKRTSAAKKAIRIGTFEVFSTYFAGALYKNHLQDEESILYELIPGEIEETLAQGLIDIGITYLPVPHQNIDHIKICDIEMSVYGRANAFKNKKFEELPFVIPVRPVNSAPTKARGLDGWPDDRVFRNIFYKVTLMESALELCRQGLAVAYLPSFIVNLHNNCVKKEFQLTSIPNSLKLKERKHSVYLVKKKTETESTLDKKLARALRMITH